MRGHFHIGEVADRVGVSLRTMRYYEEVGLVRPVQRTSGGFRLYSEDAVERLELIKRMKPLGFALDEMRDLLQLRDRLLAGTLDAREREEAAGRLASYAAVASMRCDSLRERLGAAESLARMLRDEVAAHEGSAPQPT